MSKRETAPVLLFLKITQISKQQLNIILIIFHLGHVWAWSVQTQPITMANPVKTHLPVIRSALFGSTWFRFSRSRRRRSPHGRPRRLRTGLEERCPSQIYPNSNLEVGMELRVAATLEPRAPVPRAPCHPPGTWLYWDDKSML